MNSILQFIAETWFGNIIGLIGGILGLFSFIDTYLLKFNPKIFIGSNVSFIADNKKNKDFPGLQFVNLISILLTLEIGNHRNKYGFVHDLAVRLYKAHAINPDYGTYFASNTLNKIAVEFKDMENVEKSLFSPLSILPKSSKSLNIEFAKLINHSAMLINKNDLFYIELYYLSNPKAAKWRLVNRYFLYKYAEHVYDDERIQMQYTILNKNTLRNQIKFPKQKVDLFKGVSQRCIAQLVKNIKHRILMPLYWIKDIIIFILFSFIKLSEWLYDTTIRLYFIRSKGKDVLRLGTPKDNQKHQIRTEKSFNKIITILENEINVINESAEEKAKIELIKNYHEFIMIRHKIALKVYISSADSIYVSDRDNTTSGMIYFKLLLKDTYIGYSYWQLDNNRIISVMSFSLRILDAFILHSSITS
jgi:hypothetical protein